MSSLPSSNSNYESIWQVLSPKSAILGCKVAETMPIIVRYIEVSHKKSPKLELLVNDEPSHYRQNDISKATQRRLQRAAGRAAWLAKRKESNEP